MFSLWYSIISHLVISDSLGTVDCSLPASSVLGIFQIGILEWVAISFSGIFLHSGIEPGSPAFLTDSLPTEPIVKPVGILSPS